MKRILFVCTGNTCRSPMAEALFKAKATDGQWEVRSAGVAAFDGQPASLHAMQVLAERGIDHDHQARRLNDDLVAWADLILTMTQGHKTMIQSMFPGAAEKVFTLREYVGVEGMSDIADPFGGTVEDYRRCAEEIEESLDYLINKFTG
ncbi:MULTISPECIES: low molecular weight protein arginine phosphatase [Bacillales]|uniref:Low molecular weight protein arginine phosphatase n=1 Tax=Brevibacillus aydinogluensis TaxID=927786 RepID=A0AA48RB39_9BACL|nr:MULTISPECIES: low molecular weight protein arginine phosphatase [Bacillales]MBR8659754.1 low molecular weight protein arginine phosphatase [Brevibacillus sp. NL20B1]NNV01262.1 low molecular weight protein arginine phosphatase [Brevibacillus sp. MCWH]REK60631.1 MAG: low molecular weight protein arginine phosphatase [Brevibacillus sp.]MDT3416645.1 protein-tyrosine phosphatase [Brevibacillus aydinogluensis]UFJ62035.1 low molecular weight protein arginine phosphatase [Anoxybacillus sediminis]